MPRMINRYAFVLPLSLISPSVLFAQGDSCTTAVPITPGVHTADGPSTGGGASQGDATNADWYSWTAPMDGYVTIVSCGAGVDTRLNLHQGTCGGLELMESDDDGCPDAAPLGGSLISNVLATEGTTYYIEWDDLHSGQGFEWEFILHACPNAIPSIVSGPGSLALDWLVNAPGATFTIEYGPTGFEPGTGTIITGVQGDEQPPVTIIGLTGGQEYQIWITIDCGGGNTAPFNGPWYGTAGEVIAIENDDCESATPIICGSSTSGSTTTALADGPPECGTSVSAPGVWYSITGLSGTVILNTCAGTDYDTKINVYTGACDDPECIAGNDDGSFGCYPGSEVIFEADAATTYYVLVQGYDGSVGNFTLDMACAACAPPTDIIVTPTDTLAYLSWTPGNPEGTFTVEYGPPGFTPGTGTVISGTVGVDGPPVTITGLELATGYDAYLTETCPGGEDGYPRGPLGFTTLEEPLPENAFCQGAVDMTCGQEASGDTQLGVLAVAPECGSGFISTPGLWYTFTGNGDDVTLSTCNDAEFDTKISVWSGTCAVLVCEGGVDDAAGCAGNTSAVTIATTAGTVYFALVHGYDGEAGPFTISMSCAPACVPAIANDDCSTAQGIQSQPVGACVPTQGTNVCAYTPAAPNPPCDPYSAAYDVWYSFNTGASPDHTITVATITSGLLTVALYTGCGPEGFIDCYDPQAGPIALTELDTNTVYYVQIWNEGGEGAGTFTICDEAIAVSVQERVAENVLSAWPIPVENVLTIDGLAPGSRSLRVCDTQGRTVITQRLVRKGMQEVDMTALAPGAYVVHLEGEVPASIRVVRR